jgi:hypothetical protein
VKKGEGMNLHTPKWTFILKVGDLMESEIFRKRLERSKFIGLKTSLYHWKNLKKYMSKMSLPDPSEYL